MNSSVVTPDQSRPWKNSIFNLPKKPSHLALSWLHPFLGIDLTRPFSLQILIQPCWRYLQPYVPPLASNASITAFRTAACSSV